jgi:anti-sigma regulatory factor (Ser/Thr protein kinase)/anti-anti-sigma regulatory factor
MKADKLNIKTIKVPAELSPEASSQFEQVLNEYIECKPSVVCIDCHSLDHVTSSHISLLVWAFQSCALKDIKIQLESPTDNLVWVLKVLDLNEYFAGDNKTECELQTLPRGKAISGIFANEFTAGSEGISGGLDEFMDFLTPLELPKMLKFELKTIFYEIATNIRNHSRIGDDESIVFTAKTDKNKIVMVFADSGIPFDMARENREIDPIIAGKNRQKSGLGIALINKLADKIHYMRENDAINVLIVEKNWSKESE